MRRRVLRRTKTIVFDDEPQAAEPSFLESARPNSGRRGIEALRSSARPFRADPEPQAANTGEPPLDGARQRMEMLRSELERSPISTGAPESLAALRADFRKKYIENADQPAPRGLGPGIDWSSMLKPSRVLLLVVALLAGGTAAFLATQGNRPAPEPVQEAQIEAPPPVPSVQVLVAKQAIGVGQRLAAHTLQWQAWPETALRPEYITDAATPEAITDMDGSIARFEFVAGEPIRREKLAAAGGGYLSAVLGDGMRGVSVSVGAISASGGFIVPGDHVDVVLTRATPDAGQISETILSNARILAINDKVGESGATGTPSDSAATTTADFGETATATLELDPVQAEIIINAAELGRLSLILRSAADIAATPPAEVHSANQAIRISSPFWLK